MFQICPEDRVDNKDDFFLLLSRAYTQQPGPVVVYHGKFKL